MKQKKFFAFALAASVFATPLFSSCDDDDDEETKGPESYTITEDGGLVAADGILFGDNLDQIGNGDDQFVFNGTTTLKKGTYTLVGWVYVANGATLTIEPGTIIKGDKQTKAALIVERGGKLIAQGTASEPIVFTSEEAKGSRKPGDWGGIILCGKAPHNGTEAQIEGGPRSKHGGNDAADNSGVLSYVRIEFAGYPFEKDKEINGLTLGSIGSGTQIDHIQVSYSNDDSFEWFGGAVNCKYLVAYHGWDDDFDTDNGFCGNVQYGLVVRNSRLADTSQSNGFESDNNSSGSDAAPFTTCKFSNITFVGPKLDANFQNTSDYINGGDFNPNNGSSLGKFQAAMHLRRNTKLCCYNSLAVGFPIGLIIDNQKGDAQGNATKGDLQLKNVFLAGMDITGSDFNKVYKDELITDYETSATDATQKSFSTTFFTSEASNKVFDTWTSLVGSDGYTPVAGSDLLSAASFTGLSGFETVSYVGAFGEGTQWTEGWTEFDPNNADY